ncbi:MAG: FAD-binding oxidoreductase [Deltaproteobacteria bacterium]|nr:FAD-binding oxidoreductase [Deltaproteobacteria bacterium]
MHEQKVQRIAAQLKAHPPGSPVSLRKAGVSHQVPKSGDLRHKDSKIDVSDLTSIISIDPVNRLCTAESGVTFVDLVDATLKHGLVPIVVPELKTITIGGAVAGCSIESMSFIHGGFHDTCVEYEVITAKGHVIIARPDNEHALVFQMMHGTFGTLGILAKLTFKLVPAKPFVRLEYETYASVDAYRDAIERHTAARDIDFMDGIIHSSKRYVLCLGHFVDRAPYTSNYEWLKVYYESTATRTEDYLSTPDYFFRYDRGVTNVRPNSWIGRLLLGKFMASTEWLALGRKFHRLLPTESPTVTLDVFIPISKLTEFMTWLDRELPHYPLWCVPYKRVHDYEWLHDAYWKQLPDQMFVDIAIYGMKQRKGDNAHRRIEEKLRELGGIKTLISHNYYSETEFWQIWNADNYGAVKRVTDPDNLFRDLFVKTCRAAMGMR